MTTETVQLERMLNQRIGTCSAMVRYVPMYRGDQRDTLVVHLVFATTMGLVFDGGNSRILIPEARRFCVTTSRYCLEFVDPKNMSGIYINLLIGVRYNAELLYRMALMFPPMDAQPKSSEIAENPAAFLDYEGSALEDVRRLIAATPW